MSEAYLYGNGNAMYFDEGGEQINELQKHGISAVHEFLERYPGATVYWAVWKQARQEIGEKVLEHIKDYRDSGQKSD